MDTTGVKCLNNSISRFIHLVTSCVSSTMPAEKDYRDLVSLMKHLKPVLDDVIGRNAPLGEDFLKECEELDTAVNEAREFLEKWSPRMSKILCLLQTRPLVLNVQILITRLSTLLCGLFSSSPTASPSLSNAQFCTQESQKLKLGKLSEHIDKILKCQKDGKTIGSEELMEIIDFLNLRSGQQLLNESIAVEKEKQKAEDYKTKERLDQISQTVDLMSRIREHAFDLENCKSIEGILIPSYFRCPLSLELMSDPVIVASGQTFERIAIEKWLGCGLDRCPKTGNKLSHRNLIPNYTVKALITNWCNQNNIELLNSTDNANKGTVRCKSEHIDPEDDPQCSLKRGNSASTPSLEAEHRFDGQRANEEGYHIFRGEVEKFDGSSAEHSYVHSRSGSTSSAASSVDYVPIAGTENSRISTKQDCTTAWPTHRQNEISAASPSDGKLNNGSKYMDEKNPNELQNLSRKLSFSSDSECNELTTPSHVEKLVDDLRSDSTEVQTAAAQELRFLAKYNMENRVIIGKSGAIAPLISLLRSDVDLIQKHAVTALLNLSISESIKSRIAEEGAVEPLIHVLKTGNAGAKENAAAALFSISLLDEYRIKIGRSAAVKALVDLLGSGSVRGKKDAATALFNLSIFHENKARIVQAGAVKYLIGFLDPESEMVDKAVAVLANLSTIPEGCSAVARGEGIPLLVEIVETGSQRGKENAASILLQLCINSPKYCRSILQEGAVPPLVALSQSGTPRAKEKAQQLLSHFRSQRDSAMVRGRH